MSDIRAAILNKLKVTSSLKRIDPEPIQPAFVINADSLSQLLKHKLEAVHASVDIVRSSSQITQSIANFLKTHKSSMDVGLIPGTDQFEASNENEIIFYFCEDFASCHTILVHAAYGIAETGTVVLPSSMQRPTLANFLPDNCIVLLDEDNIVRYMEDALLSVQNSDAGMPRALNFISGPSKTADIEQTLVYGAHGPIQLHVIIRQHR